MSAKHQGINDPESNIDYRKGVDARDRAKSYRECPYGMSQMKRRHLWLAGWHDEDMGRERSLYRNEWCEHAA